MFPSSVLIILVSTIFFTDDLNFIAYVLFSFLYYCYSFSVRRCCGTHGGAENAGVENAGGITYGKPSEQKTLKIPGV